MSTPEDSLASAIGDAVPVEIAPPADVAAEVTELPSTEPEMTVERALGHRVNDAVVTAFIHTEKLKGQTRKLTADGWKTEFAAFVAMPR